MAPPRKKDKAKKDTDIKAMSRPQDPSPKTEPKGKRIELTKGTIRIDN